MDTAGFYIIIAISIGLALLLGIGFSLQAFFYKRFKQRLTQLETIVYKVEELTHRHSLTKLPNRTLFFKQFETLLLQAKEENQKVLLMLFDLDNFRTNRDAFGFKLTDVLLQEVAKRLLTLKKQHHALIAHLESDQFLISIKGTEDYDKVHNIVLKIFNLFKKPFSIHGREVVTGAAIGICVYPDDGTNTEELLKRASIARYQAKQNGTNSHSFYLPEMDVKLMESQLILEHLHLALKNNELTVYYQPKVDIKTRKIIAAEALLRWHNPTLGNVSPFKFIPIAERSGLIIPISDFVLKEACIQTKVWHLKGFSSFQVAVNLSPYHFKAPQLAQEIANVLWDTKLEAQYLELEFTENALMENIEKYLLVLRVLNAMGIHTSLDDFGTGSSSLTEIMKLPLSSLKIDQSFIRPLKNIRADTKEAVFVMTIVTMAKQLGLQTIAEGVETEEQFEFLKSIGCDIAQGYLISPPVSATDFFELLKKEQS